MEYIIIALIGVIVYLEVSHQRERRDLYNRIMAKDFVEYKQPAVQKRNVPNIIRKRMSEDLKRQNSPDD
jgi:hypothetical protein